MLEKSKCLIAISDWESASRNYENIKNLLYLDGSFIFEQSQCQWLLEQCKSIKFHGYLGIYENGLILIAVPLDELNQEIDLSEYPYISYTKIKSPIHLVETIVSQTKNWVTLSTSMEVERNSYVLNNPILMGTDVEDRIGLKELENWRYYGHDWLFKACSEGGTGAPQAFSIPIQDLSALNNSSDFDKTCLFTLKTTQLYGSFVSLLFVEVSSSTSSNSTNEPYNTVSSNSMNFAQPCPPFCKNKKAYNLLPG